MSNWALFLLRVIRDELRDRAGVYRLDAPYHTRYLSLSQASHYRVMPSAVCRT
jgi:hypothetical protein